MSLSIFTHPCQRPESLPLCKVSFSTFPPPTSVTYMSVSSKSGSKTPKSDQAKCHAPFSSREHVGSIMSNMSFHDVMSRHVVMSCHVVTLETDPCVCHCQYSPTFFFFFSLLTISRLEARPYSLSLLAAAWPGHSGRKG